MKRRSLPLILLALFALGATGVWAQTLEYNFVQSTTTYTPITGGILLGTETCDDQRFLDPAVPAGASTTTGPGFEIGFNFTFNGAVFDRLGINNNGWISLGQSALTPSVNNASSSAYTPLASTTTIDPPVLYNRISALGRDLQAQVGATLRLETIGAAPNRICVIQWANYKKYGTNGTGDSLNFQIRLHETSNNVQIVYGAFVANATAGNMQVGLRGPDAADFNARQGATGWDNTTAASANTQYVVLSDVNFPANGLTFNFNFPVANQPPNPANLVSPANSAILVSPTATLNWTSGGGLPAGYRLFLGTNNPPTNLVNNQDLGAVNSYNPTPDLNLATTHYWKVVPYNAFGDAANCPVWSFTTHGDATITTLPYSQNWDLVTAPELPFDWLNIIQSTSTSAVVATYASTTYAHSQPNCARLYNPSDADATLILVGPPIGGTLSLNSVRLRFWARSSGASYPLSIGVISDPTDPATFTEVHNLSLTTTLTEYVLSMAGYTGTANRIAIKHGLGGTGRTHYIDDIVFEQIAPNDLACEALTGNTTPPVNSPTVYTAHVHNWGTATQSAYTVKLFNGNNEELVSVPGTTVAPDATVEIPMTWTPTAEGIATLYAKVILAGDINPTNDQSQNLNILVMGAGSLVVSIGDGTAVNGTSGYPTPYGTYYKNFHQQYLFTAAEILAAGGAPGPITSLAFNVQALNTCSPMQNYTIKLKNTTQAALTTTFEVGEYTQVWFQNDFLPTEGWNTHAFTTPFVWDGTSNLLVDIITTLIPGSYTQNASVYYTPTTGTNTSLRYQSDSADAASSATGTVSVNRANARISFNLAGMGALTGTVSSGGNPLTGADVVIQATNHATQTDALGGYNFPFVDPGTYSVTASKLGYEAQTLPATLTADGTTTLNFNLSPSSTVSVTGTVVGSDQPTVGLAGVAITLDGALDYSGTTSASGQFTITGVLSGNSYNYSLAKDGYQILTGTISVGAGNYNMGTLTMSEIALPPFLVVATENTAQTQVSLTWHTPSGTGGGVEDFEIENGDWVPTSSWANPLGDWQWTDNYDVTNYTDIDTYVDAPPAAAHSGTGMWGTVLTGGYTNAGGWSYLRKSFNLNGVANPVLDFWHYMDGYNTWDYGLIKVNGATLWGSSSAAEFMPWQQLTVDLSAYANQAEVEISFEWYATSTVSYAGWYIDDVYVGSAQNRNVNYVHAPASRPASSGSETEGTAIKQQRALTAKAQHLDQTASREPERVRTGYKVWRLLQGSEGNETSWIPLTASAIQDTNYVDTAWGSLPDGNYRWAVKTVYTNNVLSNPAFSNILPILRLDLAAIDISGTTTPSVGMAANYQVTVDNTSSTTQFGANYTVKLMSGTTVLASVGGSNLNAGETQVFDIVWTPSTAGPLALTGKVVLTGDTVPANDSTEPLNISVMPAGVVAVTVGEGTATEGRPVDFYYNNSLFQCLYYPTEIQMYGSITAVSFYNNFVTDLPNKPTKVWLGQTDLNDLSGGWILPTDNLTLVYDGNISYPSGENTVTIPLQTPFNYTSGNLVLYANRPMDTAYFNTNDNFRVQTIGTNRARKLTSNTTNYDPASPSAAGTLSGQFPMTTFHLAAIGNAPIFAINPSAKDFGTVLINGTYSQEFTISNGGGGPLTVSAIGVAGSPFFTLAGVPALPATINFGQTLTFTLNYAPTAAGAHEGTITILDNMSRLTHTVALDANCIDTQITTLPYMQNFDAVTPPALPPDWSSIVQSTVTAADVNTYASTTYAHSLPNCARLLNSTDTAATVILIAPPFSPAIAANGTRVKFWARSSSAGYPLSVGILGNNQDPATYTEVQSLSLTTTLQEYTVSFAAYQGTGNLVAFKHGLGGSSRTLYLDDVLIEDIPDNDLDATAIAGSAILPLGQPATFTATVLNGGTNTQNTYQVKLFKVASPADIEVASAAGTQVAPGLTAAVPVTWTPAAEGAATLYAKVVLTGDENPANDHSPSLSVLVQPTGVLTLVVGDGGQTARTPIDMYYRNSIHQYLIFPAEINNFMGSITGLVLENQFTQDLLDKPVNVWISTTAAADLSGGWVPVQTQTQVFAGTLNFPTGENTIVLPFQTPFLYLDGQNLLLTFQRPWDAGYFSSTNYFKAQTVGTNRCRKIQSDSVEYDPNAVSATGTLTGQFPKTTLFGIPGGVGHLNGTVTGSGGSPLSGVQVDFVTGGYATTTNAQGQYAIQNILPGTYSVNFSVYGYQNAARSVIITEDQTTTLDVAMVPLPMVNVTGTVIASDTQAGISGAAIHLGGYADYTVNTTATGSFTIPGVYANNNYSYTIMAPGYSTATGMINIGPANYNMGTITLNEVAYAPHSLQAAANTSGTAVDLVWQAPDPNAVEITESFEPETFPPLNWTQTITNTGGPNSSGIYNTFCRFGAVTISGQPATPTDGNYQSGLYWDYGHQDEWLITPSFNCPPAGYLNFDSYVFLGSTNNDHYYVQVSTDNGNTWTPIWDASAQTGGWNYYASPINVDLSVYSGLQIKLAFNASDGPNNDGLWYVWFFDNIYIGNAMTAAATPAVTIRFSEEDLAYKSAAGSGFANLPAPTRDASRVVENGGNRTEASLPHNAGNDQPAGRSLTGYKLWRLTSGQENNESVWSPLTPDAITQLSFTDPAWQTLPNGSYRWAVKAVYTNNVASVPSFSNVMVKIQETGMIAGVVRRLNTVPIQGATVTAGGVSATTNSVGAYTLVLPIGTYDVTCSATGYQEQTANAIVVNPNQTTTLNFIMAIVANEDEVVPVTATALLGNYPNPFNPSTTISWCLKEASPVRIEIYNSKGQRVRVLVDETKATGWYQTVWNGRDDLGNPVSSGVYMYRMNAGSYSSGKKMMLMQ